MEAIFSSETSANMAPIQHAGMHTFTALKTSNLIPRTQFHILAL
jgi:hypothetical protein